MALRNFAASALSNLGLRQCVGAEGIAFQAASLSAARLFASGKAVCLPYASYPAI
jgi:hypothetical protein